MINKKRLLSKKAQVKIWFLFFSVLAISLILVSSYGVLGRGYDDSFIITEHTEYGLFENTIYINITNNLEETEYINITNIFNKGELINQINYKEIKKLEKIEKEKIEFIEHKEKIFEIHYEQERTSTNKSNNYIEIIKYLDKDGIELTCEKIEGDYCINYIKEVRTELVEVYVKIEKNQKKEKTLLKNKKFYSHIKIKKYETIQLKLIYSHPLAIDKNKPTNLQNKYDIEVCSVDGQHCSLLDPIWFNSSWIYEKQINITENSGNNLTNYSILLYINYTKDTNSNAKIDFSDLRFLDSTKIEALGYWIINKSNGNYAYVWVKVPELIANSNTSIYMYYGNSLANDNSNIENVPNWDISTASYVGNFYIYSYDPTFTQIAFSSNGTKMYGGGKNNDRIYQYTLSTPWDVSTASYDSISISTAGCDSASTNDMDFNLDGTKMYLGGNYDDVCIYNLSTAWDISTISSPNRYLGFSEFSSGKGNHIKEDGTKLYVYGDSTIYQYTLSTPWDVSTASYDSKSYIPIEITTYNHGLEISPDGKKMILIKSYGTEDRFYQYTLGTAWDVSTASYDSKSRNTPQTNDPQAMFFNYDGSYFYNSNNERDYIEQFKTKTIILPYFIGKENNFYDLKIISHSPIDKYISNSSNVFFNCSGTSKQGLLTLNLTINGVLYETVLGNGSTNLSLQSTESLSDGDYIWKCIGNNINLTLNSTTRNLNINTTPDIKFEIPTPTNNYNSSIPSFPINVSLTETYFDKIIFNINGNQYNYTDNTRFINFSFGDGVYYYNVTTYTTTGAENSTETRRITLDTTYPQINISLPLNKTYFPNELNYSLFVNEKVDNCSFELDSTTYYMTEINDSFWNYPNQISQANGTHLIEFSCRDFAGNIGYNSSNYTLIYVKLLNPLNEEIIYNYDNLTFNASLSVDLSLNWTNGSEQTTHNPNSISNSILFFDEDNGTSASGTGGDSTYQRYQIGKNFTSPTYIGNVFIKASTSLDSIIDNCQAYSQIYLKIYNGSWYTIGSWTDYDTDPDVCNSLVSLDEFVNVDQVITSLVVELGSWQDYYNNNDYGVVNNNWYTLEYEIGNQIKNSSLYLKEGDGGWELNETKDISGSNNYSSFTKSISDGTIWNIEMCQSDGQCFMQDTNWSVPYLSTFPQTWTYINPQLNKQTKWINSLVTNIRGLSEYKLANMSIMTDTLALNDTIQVSYSNGTVISHTFNESTGYVNFTALVPGGDREAKLSNYFNVQYYTNNISLTNSSENRLIAGVTNLVHTLNLSSKSTRNILDVYSYFAFDDTNKVSSTFFKDSTEITTRADVLFSDTDTNGLSDKLEWFIENLTISNESYELRNVVGNPVQVSQNIEILNDKVVAFDNINWRNTITVYNPNNFETETVLKIELPLGSTKIELDDISKNSQYDEFGILKPYISIIDKNDPAHKSSIYLSSGQTKTFILEYTTDSVTITSSTKYPSNYNVGDTAEIINILRIKNQADYPVEDAQFNIPIDYAEDLVACEGEFLNGCDEEFDEAFDEESLVEGQYTLTIDSFDANEVKEITLTYFIPTVEITKHQIGKITTNGTLLRYDKFLMESIAPFKLDTVEYTFLDINSSDIVAIKEIFLDGTSTDLTHTGSKISLGLFDVADEKEIVIWSIDREQQKDSLIRKALTYGDEIILEKGKILYYLFGLFADEDQNGILFIHFGKLVFISVGYLILLIIIYFFARRKKGVFVQNIIQKVK